MPLDKDGRSYADALYWQRAEQIQKEYVHKRAEVSNDFIKRNLAQSGMCAQAQAKVLVWHVEQIAQARTDSLLQAYEKSGLPLNGAAFKEIGSEVTQFCRVRQQHAVQAMHQVLSQMPLLQNAALTASLREQIERGISGVVSRINRELLIKEKEAVFDKRRGSTESISVSTPDVKEKPHADQVQPPAQGKSFRRALVLSAAFFVVNIAFQLTIAKYGPNIPDWLIICLWILSLVPFVWWSIAHPKLMSWMRERSKARPVSTTMLALVGLLGVFFCVVCLAFIGRGVWHRITKPHNAVVLPSPAPNVPPSPHPYDLSGDRRLKFEEALKKQTGSRAVIRVGCTTWSEESCVAAGRFLIAFSEAGWKIDSNEVFHLEPNIPIEGVAIVTNDPKARAEAERLHLPPHEGTWHKMSPSEITFYWALRGLNIPVSSSNDPSLPRGTVGIYFGPEPR